MNHEWLSEVLMAVSYRVGGATGLAVLKLVLLVAAFGLILGELARREVPPMAQDLLLTLAIVGCFAIVRTLRPQTFSLLLFSGLLVAVRRAEDGDRRALWLIPACMPLWPNLHGGWLVGLGIYGVWTAIRCLRPIGLSRMEWAAAGIATLLATLVNPEGVRHVAFLWDTVGLGVRTSSSGSRSRAAARRLAAVDRSDDRCGDHRWCGRAGGARPISRPC